MKYTLLFVFTVFSLHLYAAPKSDELIVLYRDEAVGYASTADDTGIYAAYDRVKNFSKVMIKK